MKFPSLTKTFHHDVYPAIDPTNPALSVAGKIVLITGAGQGIGKALALAFSTAGAAHLILLGRKISTLDGTKQAVLAQSSNKAKVHPFEADITDQARIDAVFSEIVSTIGKIDIYVANAGYFPSPAPVATASIADFKTAFDINVTGQLIAAQAFLRAKAATSTLISINSGVAHVYYMGPMVGYVASKAAGIRLMDALAVENPDVRVFNLHPGVIPTAMAEKAGMSSIASDTPELAAGFSLWLASPRAEFLRGRVVHSNWDVEEMDANKAELLKNDAALQLNLVGWPFQYETKGYGEE